MESGGFGYPFLALSLILTAVFTALWFIRPAQRPMMIRSALFSAPFGLTSVVFVPEYWDPVRVAEFICGPEDLLFSLANGGTVWAAAFWQRGAGFTPGASWGRAVARYMSVVALCWAISAGLWLAGVPVMPAVLASVYGLAAFIAWRRPGLRLPALAGGVVFALVYSLALAATESLWPGFLTQWNPDVRSGLTVFGLPVEEPAWAFGFGLAWPLYMAHTFKTRDGG